MLWSSKDADKSIRSFIYPYSIEQNNFTVLKLSQASFFQPSTLPSNTTASTDSFTVSIVLFFPGCRIIGVLENAIFSYCHFLLNGIHLMFFYIFLHFDGSPFLLLNSIPLHGCTMVVYQFIYWETSFLFPFFWWLQIKLL